MMGFFNKTVQNRFRSRESDYLKINQETHTLEETTLFIRKKNLINNILQRKCNQNVCCIKF